MATRMMILVFIIAIALMLSGEEPNAWVIIILPMACAVVDYFYEESKKK